MKLGRSINGLTVFAHIIVWLLLGFIILFYPPFTWDFLPPASFWLKQLCNLLLLAALFYFTALYMGPVYLVNQKKAVFGGWCIVAIVLYLVSARIIEYKLHVLEDMAAARGTKNTKSIYTLDGHQFIVVIMVMVISTAYIIIRRWQADLKRHEMIEKQHITSELALLKAQINPHFFFNTLNNIYALTFSDVPLSREALLKLSRMMRYVLYETLQDQVLLSQEIAFMKDYLELMKLRLHSFTTLIVQESSPDREYSIAPMLFLPFIENAFKHGTSSMEKTEIIINLTAKNNVLDFSVFNRIHPNPDAVKTAGGGIGLANTQKRLHLLYPDRHQLVIREDVENRTYQVDLTIEL